MITKTEMVLILLQVKLKLPSEEERRYKIYKKNENLASDDLKDASFPKFLLNKVNIWKPTICLCRCTCTALVVFSFVSLLNSYKIIQLAVELCYGQ